MPPGQPRNRRIRPGHRTIRSARETAWRQCARE
jgi:hypothetical protein